VRNAAFTGSSRTVFSYSRRVERLGILGGTFDPVHVAHLAAAAAARDQLDLTRLLVVVAADPWQKRGRVGASAEDRLAMVEAAIEGAERLEVSRLELDRAGPTYTIDTVRTLQDEKADRGLFLVVGSDVAASIETWHRAEELRAAVTLAIVDREDVAPSIPPPGWRCVRVHMPRLDVSSTDLRRRIAAGESVDFLVPPSAARVLRARGLYTGA
jgi:nicotinate-nucleotide adenylyltransferase